MTPPPTDAEIWDAVATVLKETGEPLSLSSIQQATGNPHVLAALIRESGPRRGMVSTTFGAGPCYILSLTIP